MACRIWLSFSMRPGQTFFLNSVFLGNDRAQEISFSSCVLRTLGGREGQSPTVATRWVWAGLRGQKKAPVPHTHPGGLELKSGPREQSPCNPIYNSEEKRGRVNSRKRRHLKHGALLLPRRGHVCGCESGFITSPPHGFGRGSASPSLRSLLYKMGQHPPSRSPRILRCNSALQRAQGPFVG